MEYSVGTTLGAFMVLFGVILMGTFMSPMSTGTVAMVAVGIFAFGAISLFLGVKHGEYRATR